MSLNMSAAEFAENWRRIVEKQVLQTNAIFKSVAEEFLHRPVAEVLPALRTALAAINPSVSDDDLRPFAQAITDGQEPSIESP